MTATAEMNFEMIAKLSADLRDASKLLGRMEARFLVDLYYSIQDFRIQSAAQIRSAGEDEPNRVTAWVYESMRRIEDNIRRSLGTFAAEYRVGQWLQSVTGIGPVISAGLLAHLDVRGCQTAGHFWRFAGLDPTVEWEKKTKRPWNAKLKTLLCFKAGESFVKVQNNPNDFYGQLYATRKKEEWQKNLAGRFSDAAAAVLAGKTFGSETNAKLWYEGAIKPEWARTVLEGELMFPATIPAHAKQDGGFGMLPPAHIHARSRRFAVKIFVSHIHYVMYEDYFGTQPPKPYVFEKCPGDHRHYIAVPNWPQEDGRPLAELLDETEE